MALEAATVAITAGGPVQLNSTLKLITIHRYPTGASYVKDTKTLLYVCRHSFHGDMLAMR